MPASENKPLHVLELFDDLEFPASKLDIVSYAQDQDASLEVMDMLRAMPDRIYDDIAELNKGLGRIEDLPGTDDGWWPAGEKAALPDDTLQRVTRRKGRGQL